MPHQYFVTYKPFQVLSRFKSDDGKPTLAEYCKVAKDVYPVGRLDYDSEGLLILSNDPGLNHRLLHPSFHHEREYWVQVDGSITPDAVARLEAGPAITVEGKTYRTLPCKAAPFSPEVPERFPPIRHRAHIPTSWIRLVLTEGKNRQIRKMTAAVGYPTLRLIRYRIGRLTLDGLGPGDCLAINPGTLSDKLFGR